MLYAYGFEGSFEDDDVMEVDGKMTLTKIQLYVMAFLMPLHHVSVAVINF